MITEEIEIAAAELEIEIKRCIAIFNHNNCEEILNRLFIESRKSLNKQSIVFRSDQGVPYDLHIPKDKSEIRLRQQFLKDCPPGCEVDHIIPRSQGGADHLSNLQWLPEKLNIYKFNKLYLDNVFFPHCSLRIHEKILEDKRQREKESAGKYLAKVYGFDENSIFSLYDDLLNFGSLSVTYIMRKLKCESIIAKVILEMIKIRES